MLRKTKRNTTGETNAENNRVLEVFIPCLPPSINHSHFQMGARRRRKPETIAFVETVKILIRDIVPLKGNVVVEYWLFVSSKRTDTDNYIKILTDSLQASTEQRKAKDRKGFFFGSDNQVDDFHVHRRRVAKGQEGVMVKAWILTI